VNTFKIKQLSRVIESISKAASLTDEGKGRLLKKYIKYVDYEDAIRDLIYEVYKKFYDKNEAIYDYSMDMIKNISSNYFLSKDEMIMYAENRKKKDK
jgi:hypothetical protein